MNQFDQKAKQEKIFNEAFENLNEEQKKAVLHIDGPLFVLAGPGTGKTQILALRIGHILRHTDTQPHNILCLTYTDAGTIAMRKRLIDFIGSTAYNVHIYTFHAFTNQVIQDNMYLFSSIKELQPLSDLEKSEVFVELIDKIPNDHRLKRFKGQVYYDKIRLDNLFQDMKKESWSAAYIEQEIDNYLEDSKTNPDFLYKRKSTHKGVAYEKGDLNPNKYEPIVEKMEDLRAAIGIFQNYEKLLQEKGRYDYNDMILWVLNEFKKNEQLLLRYQEQYLYFLVDEYQDTNGVQNQLLDTLAEYWEKPNVFAVGDDDQSIYRFQGANLENITEFQKKYDPGLIVLSSNYRSTQVILDASGAIIRNNVNRLSNLLGIDKSIQARGKNGALKIPVRVLEFSNTAQEEAAQYEEICNMVENGTDLNKIAVIYRGHKQVENLIKILESRNIPINVKKKVNILTEPFIRNIIDLLRYIQSEYKESGIREDLLYKTLISPMFHISYTDIMKLGKLTAYNSEKKEKRSWMEVISNESLMAKNGVKESKRIFEIFEKLANWLQKAPTLTVQIFFEKIITESGILSDALNAPDYRWKMQLLNTFFDFIKEESVRNPKINLKQMLESIDKMELSDVQLPIQKIITSELGIHFITGHSAKGLEFEKVYIIGANAQNWEKKRAAANSFKYPDTLFTNAAAEKEEDERRVFFVAATRAEKELLISYAAQNDAGKELEKSRYIEELKESDADIKMEYPSIPDDVLLKYKAGVMEHVILPETEMIDKDLIEKELESFQMSVTALNKYLKCPVTFYYENILRVPFARNSNAGFGSAVHYALEQFFNEKKSPKSEGFGSAGLLTEFFTKGMHIYRSHFNDEEYERLIHFGEKILTDYHADQLEKWFKVENFKTEHKISNVEYQNVPIKGVIDKVEILKEQINVVDYKTGNPDNAKKKMYPPKKEDDNGGDYWRQIVFYKMLVDNDPKTSWVVQSGEINLIEPDKKNAFQQFKLVISQKDMDIVGEQLTRTYKSIKNHEFRVGCSDKDCVWCNFVKDRVMELNPTRTEED